MKTKQEIRKRIRQLEKSFVRVGDYEFLYWHDNLEQAKALKWVLDE